MPVTFARSASRHGISRERSRFVVEHCRLPFYAPSDSDLRAVVMYLGLDQYGVALEVAAVEAGPDDLIVIHAMRLRRKFRPEFELVMRGFEG